MHGLLLNCCFLHHFDKAVHGNYSADYVVKNFCDKELTV